MFRKINTEDIVRSVVTDEMKLAYYFERWETINLLWDKAKFPNIAFILPISGSLTLDKFYHDTPNCFIAFSVKNELDFSAEEAKPKVEACMKMAKEFFTRLNKHLRYPVTGNVPYNIMYSQTDTTAISVIFQVSISGLDECAPNIGYLSINDCDCEEEE